MADMSTSHSSLSSTASLTLPEDDGEKSSEEKVIEMATDFTKFLNFSVAKEENKFNDSVEMMLTKLDEFFSLVDMIRSDTTLCLTNTVPDIQAKCVEMETVFEKIDKLEEFVNIVKETVSATEEKVTKAEADLGTMGGLVKKFTSFVSLKKSPNPSAQGGRRTDYVPVKVFSTSDYFDHSKTSTSPSSSASSKESSLEVGSAAHAMES